MVVMAGIAAAAGIAQFCLQSHGFAFCYSEGTAVGIAAAVIQIGSGGDISFCGAKQRYPQVIAVGGRDTADETTKWQ